MILLFLLHPLRTFFLVHEFYCIKKVLFSSLWKIETFTYMDLDEFFLLFFLANRDIYLKQIFRKNILKKWYDIFDYL